MTLLVFGLVALSASIHVLWNTLVKQCEDKVSFAWLTSAAGTIVLIPVFTGYRLFSPGYLGVDIVFWSALSGFFEALYVFFLFRAYMRADLSVVYPLSRGVAPMATLVLGGLLLGDNVNLESGLVVGVVIIGVLAVSYSAWEPSIHGLADSGILSALGTGCAIAGYHLVDRKAMSMGYSVNPAEYLFLMHFFLLIYVSVWAGIKTKVFSNLFTEWRANRQGVVIVGLGTPLAYFLIIVALQYGNVTYITAGRNIGIFISTIVGAVFLKEKITVARLFGSILIVAGVIGLVLIHHS